MSPFYGIESDNPDSVPATLRVKVSSAAQESEYVFAKVTHSACGQVVVAEIGHYLCVGDRACDLATYEIVGDKSCNGELVCLDNWSRAFWPYHIWGEIIQFQ